MNTRVVPVPPVAAPGRTVYVDGRPALVLVCAAAARRPAPGDPRDAPATVPSVRGALDVGARGAPGAAALLLAAAAAGGSPSRAYLLGDVTGAERRALAWALRDAGDRPLTAEQCLAAADELSSLIPNSIGDGGSPTP